MDILGIKISIPILILYCLYVTAYAVYIFTSYEYSEEYKCRKGVEQMKSWSWCLRGISMTGDHYKKSLLVAHTGNGKASGIQ